MDTQADNNDNVTPGEAQGGDAQEQTATAEGLVEPQQVEPPQPAAPAAPEETTASASSQPKTVATLEPILSFQETTAAKMTTFKEVGQASTPDRWVADLHSQKEHAIRNNETIKGVVTAPGDDKDTKLARLVVGWFKADKHWAESRKKEIQQADRADKISFRCKKENKEKKLLLTVIEASELMHVTTKTKLERYEKLCERASWEDPEAPDETPSQGGGEISVKIECGSDDDVQIIERPSDASSSSSSSSGSSSSSSSSSKPKGLFAAVPGKVTRKHTAFNKPFGNVDNFPREDKIDIFALKACFDNTKKYLYHHKLLTCEYCRRALYEHYEQDKPILCCHKCCRVVWCSSSCAAAHDTHKLCCILHPG